MTFQSYLATGPPPVYSCARLIHYSSLWGRALSQDQASYSLGFHCMWSQRIWFNWSRWRENTPGHSAL